MWERLFFKRVTEKSTLRFNATLCLRERYKNSSCTDCLSACPEESLSISNGKVELDKEMCTDCSKCVHVCPTDAFYFEQEMMKKYESRVRQKESVTYSCIVQNPAGNENIISLPCLKYLSPEYFMISSLYNKTNEVLCNPEACHNCSEKWDPETGLDWINEWVRLADTNEAEIKHKPDEVTGTVRKYNRRELFQMSAAETKEHIGDFILDSYKEIKDYKEKLPQSQKRQYVLKYIQKNRDLLKKVEQSPGLIKKLNMAKVTVADSCEVCENCTSVCPTGALNTVTSGSVTSLQFYTDLCLDCDICENACSLISKKPAEHLTDLLETNVLAIKETDTCPRCKREKSVKHQMCEDCRMKEEKKQNLLADW